MVEVDAGPSDPVASNRRDTSSHTTHDGSEGASPQSSQATPAPHRTGRIRRHHVRSRAGCSQCKIRKVKCDERRPVCGGCEKRCFAELCQYPPRSSASIGASTSPSGRAQLRQTNTIIPSQGGPLTGSPTNSRPSHVEDSSIPAGQQSVLSENVGTSSSTAWSDPTSLERPPINLYAPSGPSGVTSTRQSTSGSISTSNIDTPISRAEGMPIGSSWAGVDWNIDLGQSSLFVNQGKDQYEENDGLVPADLDGWITSNGMDFDSAVALALTTAPQTFSAGQGSLSYSHQQQLMNQPDGLSTFFPTIEQRHQFRHFFHHASHSLLVSPNKPVTDNPFLQHFSHLVFGAPAGQSVAHDAFRHALLSLSSLDLGIRLDKASDPVSDNVMYDVSHEQRGQAQVLLKACIATDIPKSDHSAADLVFATVVALCQRDRLAGCQDWEAPLQMAQEIINSFGGPGRCISMHPTADRRFLVEQLAILDLIGSLTYLNSPRIFTWDSEWFEWYSIGDDHVQDVYGWTRASVVFMAQAILLFGEARAIDSIRKAQPTPNHRQLDSIIDSRSSALSRQVKDIMPRGDSIKLETQSMNLRSEVTTGVILNTTCMEVFLRTMILGESIRSRTVQTLVEAVLDISESSIAQGAYAGLLLPLNLVDGVAQNSQYKGRVKEVVCQLRGKYHMRAGALEKIINMDWALLATVCLSDLADHLRKTGEFVLLF